MATAVSVFVPSAKLPAIAVAVKLYGAVEKLRSNTAPLKSWTFVTLPSESLAEARTVTVSVLPKTALSAGLVMVTLGGTIRDADRYIHDARRGGETDVVRGHRGERVGCRRRGWP